MTLMNDDDYSLIIRA